MSLFFGGIFFAKKFREREYITMLDPFQNKFGAKMGGFIFIPCVLGELMWCASILSALGEFDDPEWVFFSLRVCQFNGNNFTYSGVRGITA